MKLQSSPMAPREERFSEQIAAFQVWLRSLKVPEPKRLILVNPQIVPEQYFDMTTARNGAYYGYPPVGLLYLAAVAKEVMPQIEVKVIDLNFEILRRSQSDDFVYEVWQDLLSEEIQRCDATHVGVTYMFGTTKETFVNACNFIRENFPNVPILVGGVQATYEYKEILRDGLCDFVVRNEGELQLKALLESCVAQQPISVPWGSAFSLGGEVYELGDSQKDVPMDWDIRPFYSQLEIGEYHKYGALGFTKYVGKEKSFATVLTNRGCRARCTFCTVRDFNGFGIKMRAVENVVAEIKFLVRERGIEHIDFLDDDLLWDPKRTVELFKGLAAQVPELEWASSNGLIAAAITEDVMHWMVESGCKAFKIGIESGNDKMLHLIKKPTTKTKLREKRELFRKYPEVFVGANFIVGFPNETFGEMMDTFDFADELKWDWCSWAICQPLKGTEQFSVFQELGDSRCDVEDYTKTPNPGRSATKEDVGHLFKGGEDGIKTGMDVFNLPYDEVPSSDQLKEIWFTFNLVTNFLNNTNYETDGNPAKLTSWLESIHSGYPYDASMCAALAQGYKLMANEEKAAFYRKKFESMVEDLAYWKRRVEEFPELLELADASSSLLANQSSSPAGPLTGAILPHVIR